MKLHNDVTFDSLNAVRDEIREWFGPESRLGARTPNTTRDMLLAVIIGSLAEELSDSTARTSIREALDKLSQLSSRR